MRIDRTNGIDPSGLTDGKLPFAKLQRPADVTQAPAGKDSVTIGTAQQPYVQAAMSSEEVNTEAVAKAQALLESGQLDTPDAIRRAAQAIMEKGL